jgi:transcriptional regulator with XRE-family HTH domain/KaiC/GvpD/RAD55 family RecA-like ATPase
MEKISSGISGLDLLIDSFYIGDNVVWEVDAGTSYDAFVLQFIKQSFLDKQKIIYVSFNRSPLSIVNELRDFLCPEYFILIDCFTAGKGKNDNTFLRFYEMPNEFTIIRIDNPKHIDEFTQKLNELEDSLPLGARYIIDSLTGMQDLWGDENSTYKFFTYMCPRLYDLGTVAYWILEKEAHSQTFKANLRHITQVVIELYKKKDKLFLKAMKLVGRQHREAFKPHAYDIEGSSILIAPAKKEQTFDIGIGSKIRNARLKLGMSQKDLADKIGLTSSFISQIENNQISPSLNSFMQIAGALNIKPTALLQSDKKKDELKWLIKARSVRENLIEKSPEYSVFSVVSDAKLSAYIIIVNKAAQLNRHFFLQKKDELIYILKGTVTVVIESREKDLKAGDSLYLKDSLPVSWCNNSYEEAELFVVSC